MTRIPMLTALLFASGSALAREGTLDPTYGTLGSGRLVYGFDLPANGFDNPAGLIVDAQGRAYTIGLSAEQNNTVARATLARLTANGGLDNTFGAGGKVVSTDAEGSFLATDIAREVLASCCLPVPASSATSPKVTATSWSAASIPGAPPSILPRRPTITAARSHSTSAATIRTWRTSSGPRPMAGCT